MVITKLRTESVYLFDKRQSYIGDYIVLNENKRIVSILVNITGHSEVLEFSRYTGKLIRPKHWLGMYHIVNYLPLVNRSES